MPRLALAAHDSATKRETEFFLPPSLALSLFFSDKRAEVAGHGHSTRIIVFQLKSNSNLAWSPPSLSYVTLRPTLINASKMFLTPIMRARNHSLAPSARGETSRLLSLSLSISRKVLSPPQKARALFRNLNNILLYLRVARARARASSELRSYVRAYVGRHKSSPGDAPRGGKERKSTILKLSIKHSTKRFARTFRVATEPSAVPLSAHPRPPPPFSSSSSSDFLRAAPAHYESVEICKIV